MMVIGGNRNNRTRRHSGSETQGIFASVHTLEGGRAERINGLWTTFKPV